METRAFRKHALLPKVSTRRRPFPVIPALPDSGLNFLFQKLMPEERHAVRELVENASVEMVDGRALLVAYVSAETLDTLSAFEAELAEHEPILEDEAEEDDDRNSDNALDTVDHGYGEDSLGERILEAITDDYEPDHDNEHAFCNEPHQWSPCPQDWRGVKPVNHMPEPPPVEHCRPAEFDREPGKVELVMDRWRERWRVRRPGARPEAVHALDEAGNIVLVGRRL